MRLEVLFWDETACPPPGPGANLGNRRVKKSESMKVTSLTGKAVITTELPRKSIDKGAPRENGTMPKGDDALSIASGSTRRESESSRKSSEGSRKDSSSVRKGSEGAKSETLPTKKLSDASVDGPDMKSKIHQRSASLPCNVRHPPKDKASSSGPSSPSEAGRSRAARNKSFGGATKSGRAPVDIFSLPETDIDSGITVACDAKSGRANRRNMRSLDLLKDSDEGKKPSPSKVGRSKSDGDKMAARKRTAPAGKPGTSGSAAAPYAPNFLQMSPADGKQPAGPFDAQRMFHVFVPDSGDDSGVTPEGRPLSRRWAAGGSVSLRLSRNRQSRNHCRYLSGAFRLSRTMERREISCSQL